MLSQNIPDIIDTSLAKLLNLPKLCSRLIDSNVSIAPQNVFLCIFYITQCMRNSS